jgi:transposase
VIERFSPPAEGGGVMLTDTQWAMLEPLVEACRPRGKTPPQDLRRTISAILWRHQNGAKWRSVPSELGPWSRAAQTFIRWSRLGVWERLLGLAQERGVELGMTFLDGTSIRAHQKAAGARKKGALKLSETHVRRLGDLVGATAPRLV